MCHGDCAAVPRTATPRAHARGMAFSAVCGLSVLSAQLAAAVACVSLTLNPVGRPDAGNPHVRFDERESDGTHAMD